MAVAAWVVDPQQGKPRRVPRAPVALERDLEGWVEADPDLLVEGRRIVGRQVHLDGGYLDLLGLDGQGRPVVVELKRGGVYRDTITQALDYASSVATMPTTDLLEIISDYLRSRPDEIAASRVSCRFLSSQEGFTACPGRSMRN